MASLPSKEVYLKLTFRYGDPAAYSFAYYTNRNTQLSGFTNVPSLEVETPQQTGGLSESPCIIRLPIDAFTDRLSDIYPHSPCHVTIEEVESDDSGSITFIQYVGDISKTFRNPEGKENLVKIEAVTDKDILDIALGLTANNTCIWTLGHQGTCNVDLTPFLQNEMITVISGKDVTIPGVITPTVAPDKFWHRGYLEFEGLRILIRDWDPTVPDIYHLVTEPPPSWLNSIVLLVPGCDKTPGTCETRYNNLGQFNGFGIGIPPYLPVIELG